MTKITLYQFQECPFCAKVRAVLHRLELPFTAIIVPHDRKRCADRTGHFH
ncbi:glutathione S-transferase N-terminal domain-containing protein [Candidatus Woesearchaeota archaeon]|nr:glutathione S-transferase N-terminal domain-containing protein [Candidatus Woesearchaeota archaeon]